MESTIMPIIIGVAIVVIGMQNYKGKINSIHWYHRKRVSEEDRLPFGRLMGIGTMICGAGVIAFGALSLVAEMTKMEFLTSVGAVLIVVALAVGLGMSLFAMIKYNKGIF